MKNDNVSESQETTKILYVLIGPKGAGKTTIGMQVHRHTDIHFLRVESIWLSLAQGENGWHKVEKTIDGLFQTHDHVMIESLGAGDGFADLLANLKSKYEVRMIKVMTEPSECLNRVRSRDRRDHIPVSDDKVREYNEIAAKVEYDWFAVIDNNGPARIDDIINVFMDNE